MKNEINGVFRAFLASAFGVLAAKGFLSEDQVTQLIELVLGIGGVLGVAAWSYATNRLKAILKVAAASPDVSRIEAEPDLANSIPSEKVVPDDLSRVQ